MFIENLRHVRKKWKIPMLIGVLLIIIGLMGSYALWGSSYSGTSASTSGVDLDRTVANLKDTIKAIEDEMAENPEDGTLAYELGQNYYVLGSYQYLLIDDEAATASFASAISGFEQAATLYTSETSETEWVELYKHWIAGYVALDDPDNACAVFQNSLEPLKYNADVLESFSTQMLAAEEEDALIQELTALAEDVPEEEEDYLTSVNSYITNAQISLIMNMQEQTSAADTEDSSEAGE